MTPAAPTISVIIAVDFGQTGSGFAHAFLRDRRVQLLDDWPDQTIGYVKTPSALLYGPDPDGGVAHWGFSAFRHLASLYGNEEANRYRIVSNFKIDLFRDRNNPTGAHHVGRDGRSYPVIDLIADYLTEMRKFALAKVRVSITGELLDEEVLWCLTTPAVWTPADKQVMRKAAQRAGMIGEGAAEASRLCLLPEPAAAALYCQEKDSKSGLSRLEPGKRFLVVDAGGGTVDVTTHEVMPDLNLREVIPAAGGPYGASAINEEFRAYLRTRLGVDVVHDFVNEQLAYIKLNENFERAKCQFKTSNQKPVYVDIPAALVRLMRERHPDIYKRLLSEQSGDSDNLRLPYAIMEDLFRKVMDGVLRVVGDQLDLVEEKQRLGDLGPDREWACDYLFLVGGFSNSELLRGRIQKAFSNRVRKIIMPSRPEAAVLWGAAAYGLDPAQLGPRRSQFTYGFRIQSPFRPGIDPESKRNPTTDRCPVRFHTFVKAGALVAFNDYATFSLRGVNPKATYGRLVFYSCPRQDVIYTDEEDVVELGFVTVEYPKGPRSRPPILDLHLFFGRTEIAVEAINRDAPDKPVRCTLEFRNAPKAPEPGGA